jgi:Cytochrome P460
MKRIVSLLIAMAMVTGIVFFTRPISGDTDRGAAPIYGITIPAGYREWKLISVSEIAAGYHSQLRAEFGNDIAIKAFQQGKLPFPDGAIIAAQHWTKASSPENDKVLTRLPMVAGAGSPKSFVPGSVVNVQFMVKDSKKYAATGGWGFADFKDGKPSDEALHKTCFPCHEPARNRDFVFTRYAPQH